jgi:hypothetical protein
MMVLWPWVAAVNADGRWGQWAHVVIRAKSEVRPAIEAVLAGQEVFSACLDTVAPRL